MTSITTSLHVFLTAGGIPMLLAGTGVGAVFALLSCMIAVMVLPVPGHASWHLSRAAAVPGT